MFCPQISALLFSFGLEDGDSRDIPNSSIPTSLASNMPETPSTIEFKLFITKKKKEEEDLRHITKEFFQPLDLLEIWELILRKNHTASIV